MERDDQAALFRYASCLKDGVGVEKNLKEALRCAKSLQGRETSHYIRGSFNAEVLVKEIEAAIAGKPVGKEAALAQKPAPVSSAPKLPRNKSMLLALALAFFFGPFGLIYVSWKRALVMLLVFIVGISLIPDNGFVILLFWLVAPVASIFALGLGPRLPPPA